MSIYSHGIALCCLAFVCGRNPLTQCPVPFGLRFKFISLFLIVWICSWAARTQTIRIVFGSIITLFRYNSALLNVNKFNGAIKNIRSQDLIKKIWQNTQLQCIYVFSCIWVMFTSTIVVYWFDWSIIRLRLIIKKF